MRIILWNAIFHLPNTKYHLLFDDRHSWPDYVVDAIKRAQQIDFLPGTLRRKAKRFDKSLFVTKIRKIVDSNW